MTPLLVNFTAQRDDNAMEMWIFLWTVAFALFVARATLYVLWPPWLPNRLKQRSRWFWGPLDPKNPRTLRWYRIQEIVRSVVLAYGAAVIGRGPH